MRGTGWHERLRPAYNHLAPALLARRSSGRETAIRDEGKAPGDAAAVAARGPHRPRQARSGRAARLGRMLATMPVAVIETDAAGVIAYANAAAARILRLAPAEVEGRRLDAAAWRISTADGVPLLPEHLPAARALRGETVTDLEHAIADPGTGERVVLSVSAAPIFGAGGEIEGATTVLVDVTERHRAQAALRASERRLRLAQEAGGIGLWDWDIITGRVFWSEGYYQLWDLDPAEVMPSYAAFLAHIHPDDRPAADAAVSAALAGERPLDAEWRVLTRDGSARWMAARGEVVRDAAGTPTRMLGVCLDVTGRRRAEEAARTGEARFQAALTGSPIFVYEMDTDLRYRWVCNPPPPLAPEDWVGRRDDETAPPEHAEPRMALKRKVIETGIGARAEVTHDRGGGEIRTYDLTLEPVLDEQGQVVGLRGAALDVTERRRAETALSESTERLRLHALLLESMAEGVSLSTEDGIIVYANPAEERMFGYGPGELVGRHVSVQNAYSPEENRRIVAEVIATLKAQGVWRGEWLNRRKDGSTFVTAAHISAVEVAGRQHWLCVQADVTEQRQAAAALRESEKRYKATQEHAGVGIAEVDASGRFLRVNAALCAITGYPREALLTRTVFDVTHPEDAREEQVEYARLVAAELDTYARARDLARTGPRPGTQGGADPGPRSPRARDQRRQARRAVGTGRPGRGRLGGGRRGRCRDDLAAGVA